MEELLREAFTLGQQWVQDMNNDKDPINFNDWYNSKKKMKFFNLLDIKKETKMLTIFLESYKQNYWESDAIDVDKILIDRFIKTGTCR